MAKKTTSVTLSHRGAVKQHLQFSSPSRAKSSADIRKRLADGKSRARKDWFRRVYGKRESKESRPNHAWFLSPEQQKAIEEEMAAWWRTWQLPDSLRKSKGREFSQNDEDGILEYMFKNLNTTNKYYVEFGAEDGQQDNTRRLREHFGWHGLTMDDHFENQSIGLYKERVSPSNIVAIFEKYRVPKDMDLLSVDVDSFDAFVLKSILSAGYQPRVLVVEANDNFGEDSFLSFPGDVEVHEFGISQPDCGQTCSFADPRDQGKIKKAMCGASVRAVDYIAGQAGYQSVYLNRVNLFLVHKSLLPSSMPKKWPLRKVLSYSRRFHREEKPFPRSDCSKLISGLVDVRDI